MAPYRIVLYDKDGGIADEHVHEFDDDDAAIDHAGSLSHPHQIWVVQGERPVAEFPPLDLGSKTLLWRPDQ